LYYSDEVIDEVISRNDIVNVISGYVSLRKKGRTFEACCPFHHEKTPSFKVDRDKQLYHCFGCGAGGNVFTFIMEYENMSFPEAVQYLADKAGMTLPESNQSGQDASREKYKILLRDMNKTAAAYFHYIMRHTEHGKKAYEYFKGRGLSDETINQFGLGYADIYRDDLYRYLKGKGYTDAELKDSGLVLIDEKNGGSDKFWNRAMIPILDINGKVIGFGGRVMGDGKPKYINTSDTVVFDKSRNLFAMNIARRSRRKGFICCEGYMDVISMHQAGFDNAVASLGTAFTFGHANILKRYTKEVYLAYDSDGAGVKDLIIDPGFGFGKTLEHNYEILNKLEEFSIFQLPILVGVSRKSMIYKLLGGGPENALNGTTAVHAIALMKGANLLRVHDVKAAVETVRIFNAMQNQ
jgi:DNA primase